MSLTPSQRDGMVDALRRAQRGVDSHGQARPWVEPIHLIVRVVEDLVNDLVDDDTVNERSEAIFGPRGTTKGLDVIRTAALLASEDGENPEYDRALVEMVYDLTGIETSAQRLREIQQAQHPRQAEHRRAHIRKHTEVPDPGTPKSRLARKVAEHLTDEDYASLLPADSLAQRMSAAAADLREAGDPAQHERAVDDLLDVVEDYLAEREEGRGTIEFAVLDEGENHWALSSTGPVTVESVRGIVHVYRGTNPSPDDDPIGGYDPTETNRNWILPAEGGDA